MRVKGTEATLLALEKKKLKDEQKGRQCRVPQKEKTLMRPTCPLPLNMLTPELFWFSQFNTGIMAHMDINRLKSVCVCVFVLKRH